MALIFTPGHFRDRADFYHQVATLVSAGYGLPQALEHLRDNPPARAYRKPLTEILLRLQQGSTFAEALEQTGTWMPEFDTALLEAGEKSGRIDSCLRLLADYYQERCKLARTVIGEMAYPALLLHAALFIPPFPQLFLTGNWKHYLLITFGILIPIYILVLAGIYLMQGARREGIRLTIEKLIGFIPLIGRARRHLALARLAMALEALLAAGVNIVTAWQLSARASSSPTLVREISGWPEQIEFGVPPSELLKASRQFPTVFTNLYTTGEASGRLDDHLNRIHNYFHESGTSIMRQIATWAPKIAYLAIVIYIAYTILSFYTRYFKQINDLTNF